MESWKHQIVFFSNLKESNFSRSKRYVENREELFDYADKGTNKNI